MMFVLRKENDQVSVQDDREIKQYTGERRTTLEFAKSGLRECLCGFQERPR